MSITHRAKNLVPVPRVENHCADVAVLTSAAGHALGTALKRECISGTSTMDVSSTTNRPQESGWSSFLLKRPAALLHMDDREIRNEVREVTLRTPSNKPVGSQRKTVVDAAREYLERSKQRSRKTYFWLPHSRQSLCQSCKRTYFDEIRRDDTLDYVYLLRNGKSAKTGSRFGESTVFNYFLKTMVFLNDCGIARHVAKEDWVQK